MLAPGAQRAEGFFSAKVSQAIAVLLVLGYCATLLDDDVGEYLALVPGSVIPRVWTLVSCAFLETRLVQLLFCVVGLLFTAKVLEPQWGSAEFAKFVGLVAAMTGAATFVMMMVIFMAQGANHHTLYLKLSGFHGVLGGLLVGIKQALPDREARIFSVIRIPGKYLPSIYLLAAAAVGFALREPLEVGLFASFGTYFAWWYLRFFQPRHDGGRCVYCVAAIALLY